MLELPGFEVDVDDLAGWRDRSCPSGQALDQVEQLAAGGWQARVVWLTSCTHHHDEDDDICIPEESSGAEGVVVRGYLGRYDACKILS